MKPGIYKIINVQSHSSVRSYTKNEIIYVASTREFPGPFELVRTPLPSFLPFSRLMSFSVGHNTGYWRVHHQERRARCLLPRIH
jgi:hypothetical protein